MIFQFRSALRFPSGTRIDMRCHYDNSSDNPFNLDPTSTVRWGSRLKEDEMCNGVLVIREH
jgi:hypothetical protein